MTTFIAKLVERILCVLLAVLFCQFPSYLDQYTNRLSGHIGELSLVIQQIEQLARNGNKSVEQYIKKFSNSSDVDFKSQGALLQNILDRKTLLQQMYTKLISAPVWKKPLIFVTSLDPSIAMQSVSFFKPSLVISFESAVYAFLGILAGIGLFKLIALVISALWRPQKLSNVS